MPLSQVPGPKILIVTFAALLPILIGVHLSSATHYGEQKIGQVPCKCYFDCIALPAL